MASGTRPAADGSGLRPRPAADPAVAALVAAAALELWPRPPDADPAAEAERVAREERAGRTWRLSGRWWTRPVELRRDRPWAR